MGPACRLFACVWGAWLWGPSALAQEPVQVPAAGEGFEARARVRTEPAATNDEDPTASGTEIDMRERGRQMEEVAEAIIEVPGVRAQSSGGIGGFTGVSLRGAEVGHTTVLLGAIPLNTPDSGSFDLSFLPAGTLDAVQVYRGGVPLWFDQGAIGGVVRHVPARARGTAFQGDVQVGSYGLAEARATATVERLGGHRPGLLAHAAITRADNDYEFYLDSEPLEAGDGEDVRRQTNAQVHLGSGLLHGAIDVAGGRMEALVAGQGRTEGVPGPLQGEQVRTRRQRVWLLGGLSWSRERVAADGSRASRFQVQLSGSHLQNRLSAPPGSGLAGGNGSETDDGWSRAHARVAYGVQALPWAEPSFVLSGAFDRFSPENVLEPSIPARPSRRVAGAVGAGVRLSGRLLGLAAELRPSALLQLADTRIDHRAGGRDTFRHDREVVPTYRLAAALAPARAFTLSSSLYSGTRLPSLFELFGDNVYVLASPELEPESSIGADVGVVARGRVGPLGGRAELRGFATWIEDLIQARNDSTNTLYHDNIGSGRILGIEGGGNLRVTRHFLLAGSLTAITTRSQFGRALPFRPPLQALLRPEVRLFLPGVNPLSLFGELHHVAFAYQNVYEGRSGVLHGRTFLGAGVRALLFDERVSLQLRVRNLLDQIRHDGGQNLIDVAGRALPGRQVLLSLSVRDGV